MQNTTARPIAVRATKTTRGPTRRKSIETTGQVGRRCWAQTTQNKTNETTKLSPLSRRFGPVRAVADAADIRHEPTNSSAERLKSIQSRNRLFHEIVIDQR